MKADLEPYFKIVIKVREGELEGFKKVIEEYKDLFIKDENFVLINRLRHNVIKFGLRKINISYSNISLSDVTKKLGLDSIKDTEYIVAKAIRDGVIEATIDRENGTLKTREVVDVYTSKEPQSVFDKRIKFCMELYQKSVKALEFVAKDEKKDYFGEEDDDDNYNDADVMEALLDEFDDL